MSRSQFQSKRFILRHAWLNLWNERMTTGRINQVATFSPAATSCHPTRGQQSISVTHTGKRKNIAFGFTRPLGTVLSSYSAFASALNTKEAYSNIPLSNKDHKSSAGSWLCTDWWSHVKHCAWFDDGSALKLSQSRSPDKWLDILLRIAKQQNNTLVRDHVQMEHDHSQSSLLRLLWKGREKIPQNMESKSIPDCHYTFRMHSSNMSASQLCSQLASRSLVGFRMQWESSRSTSAQLGKTTLQLFHSDPFAIPQSEDLKETMLGM